MGPLMFNSTDPCVYMAYPTCQRLELAASLDRKVQRPDKMGRKKKLLDWELHTGSDSPSWLKNSCIL